MHFVAVTVNQATVKGSCCLCMCHVTSECLVFLWIHHVISNVCLKRGAPPPASIHSLTPSFAVRGVSEQMCVDRFHIVSLFLSNPCTPSNLSKEVFVYFVCPTEITQPAFAWKYYQSLTPIVLFGILLLFHSTPWGLYLKNQVLKQDYWHDGKGHAQFPIIKTVSSRDTTSFPLGTPSQHTQVFVLGL